MNEPVPHSPLRTAVAAGRTILLLGNYRATIVCVRELARAGYRPIVGCDRDEEGGAEHSRFRSEVWEHSPAANRDAFERELSGFLAARPDVAVVLPVSERYVRFLAERHAFLPPGPVYATPDPEAVLTLLEKERSFALARSVGVPVAPFATADTLAELYRAADAVGFPLIVRPYDSTYRLGANKAVVCRNRDDLAGRFPIWPVGQRNVMVQRIVGGRRRDHWFAACHGRLFRLCEAAILRTDRVDGTGVTVDGVTVEPSPDLVGYTQAITNALGYHGVGNAQYLVDEETGAATFLEINPRMSATHAPQFSAGLGLSVAAVRLAQGLESDAPLVIGRAGIRYAWTYGELRSLKAQFRDGTIRLGELPAMLARVAATALRADVHLTWSWDDPRPALAGLVRIASPREPRTGDVVADRVPGAAELKRSD